MSFWEPNSITDVVNMIGIIGVVGTLYATMRLRKTSVAMEYVKRYWEIADGLRNCQDDQDQQARSAQVRRYLELCDDEFEVVSKGLIDSRIWHLWHDGICSARQSGEFAEDIARALQGEQNRFDRSQRCAKRCAKEGQVHKAWKCPAVREFGRHPLFPVLAALEPRRKAEPTTVPPPAATGSPA